MHVERRTVALTTDGSGDAVGYADVATGRVLTARYVKGDFDDGVDFTITVDGTGETIWAELDVNASATRAPRQASHGTDGVAAVYAELGEPVLDHIAIANDRIKVVVANGGAGKTGTFHFLIG